MNQSNMLQGNFGAYCSTVSPTCLRNRHSEIKGASHFHYADVQLEYLLHGLRLGAVGLLMVRHSLRAVIPASVRAITMVQHTIRLHNMPIESLHSSFRSEVSAVDDDTKQIIRHFLTRHPDGVMQSGLSTALKYKLNEESCNLAETAYGHTSVDHQYFIALFTAGGLYAEDHCTRDPEPVGQFAKRFTHGEGQLDPVLDCLANHIKTAYDFWPAIGATAIINSTLDFMTAVYIENTKAITTTPSPTVPRLFPHIIRPWSSVCVLSISQELEGWNQLVPSIDPYLFELYDFSELCFILNCGNDVLSFYKECVAGETDNYIHLRAATEQKTPTAVLRELANEVANTIHRVEALAEGDGELAAFCHKFFMGYIEFHVNTPRYDSRN
ncbi:hypothetical protein A0H81_02648 [Grifola frondosa]|uniref:Trichodiene synthase n=1 Tax=Grifola frondosa TaxID=5627 RepID=A0A1C7MLC9_GRIFR|nr:hypothetical protein A0H81_02648 [Grifola frondosa]